jgi:hypothetical protein
MLNFLKIVRNPRVGFFCGAVKCGIIIDMLFSCNIVWLAFQAVSAVGWQTFYRP